MEMTDIFKMSVIFAAQAVPAVRESPTVIASPQPGMAAGERLRGHRCAPSSRWLWTLSLAAIVLLAAGLRLNRLDLIDFRFDQAYPLQYAMDIVRGHMWGVQPHGSVAGHPAAYLYVMALPYLVMHNFMAVVVYRVMFDVMAVALCGLIGVRYFNRRVGFIASLLFAVGPWAIQFARNLWPVPQPLFTAILLIGLLEIVDRRNPWGWALSGFGLALVAGTHLAGLYVVPVVIVAFWIGRKTFKLLPALIGAVPIISVIAAFLIHDAAHQFENLRAYFLAFGGASQFSLNVMQFSLWLSGGLRLGDLTGQGFSQWINETPSWLSSIDVVQVAWLVVSVFWLAIRVFRSATQHRQGATLDAHWQNTLVVLLWLCAPILLQLRSSRPVMMQYLPVLLPAPFLLMAIAADDWLRLASRARASTVRWFTQSVILGAIGVIAFWQIATTIRFTNFVDQHDTRGGYGLPVRSALAARQQAVESLARGDVKNDLILVIRDFPTPWNEQAAILRAVMADLPYRFLNSESDGFVFRLDGTHYIFAPGAEPMLKKVLAYTRPGAVITSSIPAQPGSDMRYTYLRLTEPMDVSGFADAPKAIWENGVELLKQRIEASEKSLRVETLMRVLHTPPEGVDYHWYNHVFAGQDKIAQKDGGGVHPASWRAGDWLLQSFDIDLPEQFPPVPLHVRIGSYVYPEIKGVMTTEPGRAPADGVNLETDDMPQRDVIRVTQSPARSAMHPA